VVGPNRRKPHKTGLCKPKILEKARLERIPMPHDLPKAYDPTAIEDHWAEYWVREKLFEQPTPKAGLNTSPDASNDPAESEGREPQSAGQSREPFTILLPPPNVTGRLHMGHMLNQTEMDILTRWHRMKGEPTLWLPGTDHAGIATQMMVEKQVVAEGTTRQALGREAFLDRVWQWRNQYGTAILDQMKRLGASVDWQREYFTMDAGLSVAVREAFTRLYSQGLIYRGAYVVNWCPGCQTAVSDLEVVHEETLGKLWEIRYPVVGADGEYLTIATTRPETMLGDVAVAIHPEDERYLHLHGKMLRLPLVNREIPIVLDTWVSRDFGTGAVKVTPAHDPNDFALGQRHHLPSINIMDDTAHIVLPNSPYNGLDRYEARKRIVDDLDAAGLLGTIHDHKLSVGRCDRSKDVVEPRLSTQWFIAVNKTPSGFSSSIAARAIQAVEDEHIQFTPEQYKKTYLNWMTNIHDWCISRQLWWGHRIPAWHCATCHKITVPKPGETADPTACEHCNSTQLTQETDVLDTWFSSGLLPVSVFGWPFLKNQRNEGAPSIPAFGMGGSNGNPGTDFNTFYPTSLLVTGFDILFFWVARMIMLGCWFALDVPMRDGSKRELKDSVPFKHVYIHALVRDANREKMSKTKGNVIDPIEIVKQYGTDAVRFTLASMASPGTDIAFNVARTEGYRAFANKIWNAARFIFMNVDRAAEVGIKVDPSVLGGMPTVADDAPLEVRWIVAELHKTSAVVNRALGEYRFDEAAFLIYKFFWGSFCDWYLEIVKLRLNFTEEADKTATASSLTTLMQVFECSLRLLSPFMPFLTEEIWHAIYNNNTPLKSVALTEFPQGGVVFNEPPAHAVLYEMDVIQGAIVAIRAMRKDLQVPEKEKVKVFVHILPDTHQGAAKLLIDNERLIGSLARVESLVQTEAFPSPLQPTRSMQYYSLSVQYEKPIDIPAERERLTKEIAKLEKNIAAADRQLGNDAFLAKAPANIVEGLKKQQAENRELLAKAQAALAALPPE
jgi:valyl-tRNA synthetase